MSNGGGIGLDDGYDDVKKMSFVPMGRYFFIERSTSCPTV